MGDVTKGLESGFVATAVISVLLLIQQALGILPSFNLIDLAMTAAGTPNQIAMGWSVHFIVGVVLWGAGFAAFSPHLPGPHWLRGAMFGVLTWLVMMILFLPTVGMPIFAAGLGLPIPLFTLGLNLVFGVVLGETYHLLLHYLPSEVDENA
jgi:hypothetical protein